MKNMKKAHLFVSPRKPNDKTLTLSCSPTPPFSSAHPATQPPPLSSLPRAASSTSTLCSSMRLCAVASSSSPLFRSGPFPAWTSLSSLPSPPPLPPLSSLPLVSLGNRGHRRRSEPPLSSLLPPARRVLARHDRPCSRHGALPAPRSPPTRRLDSPTVGSLPPAGLHQGSVIRRGWARGRGAFVPRIKLNRAGRG